MTRLGFVSPGFERVRDAFVDAQANDSGGAQLCIYRNGEVVVDLATGQDVANARPVHARHADGVDVVHQGGGCDRLPPAG